MKKRWKAGVYAPGGKLLRRMTFTVFPPAAHGRKKPKPVIIRLKAGADRCFTEAQEIEQLGKITDAIEQQYPSHEWRMTRVRRDEWNFTAGELKPVGPRLVSAHTPLEEVLNGNA